MNQHIILQYTLKDNLWQSKIQIPWRTPFAEAFQKDWEKARLEKSQARKELQNFLPDRHRLFWGSPEKNRQTKKNRPKILILLIFPLSGHAYFFRVAFNPKKVAPIRVYAYHWISSVPNQRNEKVRTKTILICNWPLVLHVCVHGQYEYCVMQFHGLCHMTSSIKKNS